jgi:hypothetical protein
VIYGLLLLLAYSTTNIIWLYLMITPILCGLFLGVLNLTHFSICQKISLMSSHSLAVLSKPFSVTMVESSITPLTHSSPPKGYFYRCLVLTLLHRMVKPSASFAPSIICCVSCFFRLLFWLAIGYRAPHRHIFAEPPPHQGDQHDQSILCPPWSCPLL